MKDSYLTVAGRARVKTAVGACRFIATVDHVSNEEEALAFIKEMKAEFRDATHNAFAYKIFVDGAVKSRCGDDGEPVYTAGVPMLEVLDKYNLQNTAVVGTRYFGGVKLGIGGLTRAYRLCAENGIQGSRIVEQIARTPLSIEVSYERLGNALKEIEGAQGKVKDIKYGERAVVVRCKIRQGLVPSFLEALREVTRGDYKILDN
ncbi:MAG TPA: YigZ family protein [Firmicutes bacterium]|nr:YigZ family protein [Bacillota bacterium]